ncbi:unnamed protein product [Nezara viridula]|uniref:Uncharacterized protein n=1 Tax=Nezara viridula TaxID=85310 RepID=A0A9P0H253_NEZVI|nr:unnamed protein product [Nezara viridula]
MRHRAVRRGVLSNILFSQNSRYSLFVREVVEIGQSFIYELTMDKRLFNVVHLGLGFMFVFTAFQTLGNIEASWFPSGVLGYEAVLQLPPSRPAC